MIRQSEQSVSIWMTTAEVPTFPPLDKDIATEVCIVGGGIAGITSAYLLSAAGKEVVLIDDKKIGGGETARTTGHLTWALDDRYFELARLFGNDGARLAAQSHSMAIDKVEAIVQLENIDCDFERLDGYLFAAKSDTTTIDKELSAISEIGIPGVRKVTRAPIDSFDSGPCLLFSNQAQFHALRFISHLAKTIDRRPNKIYNFTHATDVQGGKTPVVTTSSGFKISAESVIVATNSPINNRYAIHTKQAAYRTYVIALVVPAGSLPKMLLWDTGDPYHYARLMGGNWRTQNGSDLLIVGGEDHKTGQESEPEKAFTRLERWTRARFPMAKNIEFKWSGQIMEPIDSLAYIGHNATHEENIYVATGDSGNGLTHGMIAGMLLTDLILHQPNPWEKLYDPHRLTPKAIKGFAAENLNVAAQYGEWISPLPHRSLNRLARGEGALIQSGLKKYAAFCDQQGKYHILSASCPHLGCVVHWNKVEKTWDCPCHGSRFSAEGKVIDGPAIDDLKKIDESSTLKNLEVQL